MVSEVETNPDGFADHAALHRLLTDAFASMAGRIDPPSSMTAMTVEDVRRKAEAEDLFLVRTHGTPVGCLFGLACRDTYHVGKLAVAEGVRGRGYARALIEAAAARATRLGLACLVLQSRVELAENHAAFRAMGFEEAGRTAHPGYDRPTSVTFRRPV